MIEMTDDERNWLINTADANQALIDDSKVFLSLFSGDMTKEALPCLQLGIAMMLDKPIIVVARPNEAIPTNLVKVARAVLRGDPADPAFRDRLGPELKRLAEEED